MHDNDEPQLNREDQEAWYNYLSEFKRDVLPQFKHHGFSQDTALIVWTLQRVANQVRDLEEALVGESEED